MIGLYIEHVRFDQNDDRGEPVDQRDTYEGSESVSHTSHGGDLTNGFFRGPR